VWFCRPDGLKLDEKKRIFGYCDYFMLEFVDSVASVSV